MIPFIRRILELPHETGLSTLAVLYQTQVVKSNEKKKIIKLYYAKNRENSYFLRLGQAVFGKFSYYKSKNSFKHGYIP